jgi:hypothetical protein
MYLSFPKARFWLRPSLLQAYGWWCIRETAQSPAKWRERLRGIWSPRPHLRLPRQLQSVRQSAVELGVRPGWFRYPTDGLRIQVFDARRDRVCKVANHEAGKLTMRAELEARANVGDFAPKILACSCDESAFVEEWIEGTPGRFSLDVLGDVLSTLVREFYRIEYVDDAQYRAIVASNAALTERERDSLEVALSQFGDTGVPVSRVHGDLVPHNLRYNFRRGWVLLDWEYSRRCLVTYDCWVYLYDHYRRMRDRQPLPDEFFAALQRTIAFLPGQFDRSATLAIHLLHLLERSSFVRKLTAETSVELREAMDRDMDTAAASLLLDQKK